MLGAARHRDPIDHEKTEKGRINKKLDHLKELAEPLAVAYGIKKAKEMGELETAFYKAKFKYPALRPVNLAGATAVAVGLNLMLQVDAACHPANIVGPCSSNVKINKRPAARIDDGVSCSKIEYVMYYHAAIPKNPIITGSGSVFINRKAAARIGDAAWCGSFIIDGSKNVNIGD